MPEQSIPADFIDYSANRLDSLHNEIATCLGKLNEEQIWHRGAAHENSIGNLLLHLEGNVRQWILHGLDDQPDIRRRDDEFTLAPSLNSKTAFANLTATVAEARQVIGSLAPARLTEIVDPQPTGIARHVTILSAIYRIVSHFAYHTGQIVLLTKQLTGADLDLTIPRKR
ncbi:MAG TPA: DUF1572 family protein [Acidobacteriaceae bacterium]